MGRVSSCALFALAPPCACACLTGTAVLHNTKGVRGVLSFDGYRHSLLQLVPPILFSFHALSLIVPAAKHLLRWLWRPSSAQRADSGSRSTRKPGRDGNNRQTRIKREVTSLHGANGQLAAKGPSNLLISSTPPPHPQQYSPATGSNPTPAMTNDEGSWCCT